MAIATSIKPMDKLFTQQQSHLIAVAYRMLGSKVEAEDVVHDAYLRWCRHWRKYGEASIDNPPAFLTSMVARLCIDQLRHRKLTEYKGPWLPEPIPSTEEGDPGDQIASLESLNTGLLLVLEKLSPLERAVFMLHEAFDYSHGEIAQTLEISLANSRQLLSRARRSIKSKPDSLGQPAGEKAEPLASAFLQALQTEDLSGLKRVLCDDVVAYSDGGGKVSAAIIPLEGIERVATVFGHLVKKFGEDLTWEWAQINGQHGLLLYEYGQLGSVTTFDLLDGKIYRIYVMRNPDKLGGLDGYL